MVDYASDGGHFYDRDGTPRYTYINKKGIESPTTLRQAKEHGWLPSVTEVMKLAAKPGLDQWKQEQTILACLTLPKVEGESEDDYIYRIKLDAKAQAKKAAEKGTEIHGVLERGFREKVIVKDPYFFSVYDTIFKECGYQTWTTEKSFASSLGYGGKTDLSNDLYLIDFKGTDKPMDSLKLWDDHYMQLGAYDSGLGGASRKCGICYVHRDTAESRLIWADEKKLLKGLKRFLALLDFYYATTELQR